MIFITIPQFIAFSFMVLFACILKLVQNYILNQDNEINKASKTSLFIAFAFSILGCFGNYYFSNYNLPTNILNNNTESPHILFTIFYYVYLITVLSFLFYFLKPFLFKTPKTESIKPQQECQKTHKKRNNKRKN